MITSIWQLNGPVVVPVYTKQETETDLEREAMKMYPGLAELRDRYIRYRMIAPGKPLRITGHVIEEKSARFFRPWILTYGTRRDIIIFPIGETEAELDVIEEGFTALTQDHVRKVPEGDHILVPAMGDETVMGPGARRVKNLFDKILGTFDEFMWVDTSDPFWVWGKGRNGL